MKKKYTTIRCKKTIQAIDVQKNTSIRCNNYIQLVEAEIWKRLIASVQLNKSGGRKKSIKWHVYS